MNVRAKVLKRPVLVGLTGGPGVGKTEAAANLEAYGASVISADDLGRELLENKKIKSRIIGLLGPGILNNKGRLDRRLIGKMIFDNAELMLAFNRIIHPLLLKKLKAELRKQAENTRRLMVVVDAALIFEWGIADWFDIILVVTAPRQQRLERLHRLGLSFRQAQKRIAAQLPQRVKISLADYVIDNNGSHRRLKSEIDRFARIIKKLA